MVTLDIGAFRAKETILQNDNGSIYHSEQLRDLSPHRCTYGYDVLVYVGRELFIHCRNEQQIIEDLGNKNVLISPRQIGFLGKKFIVMGCNVLFPIEHILGRLPFLKSMNYRFCIVADNTGNP